VVAVAVRDVDRRESAIVQGNPVSQRALKLLGPVAGQRARWSARRQERQQIIEACSEDGMHKHLPGNPALLRFPE